jgi:hypothetical protein
MNTNSSAVVSYAASRLHFKTAIIEPLSMTDRFRIGTPYDSFEMSKADFYRDFANVVASRSYREGGGYHSKNPPQKASKYLVEKRVGPVVPDTEQPSASPNRRLTKAELSDIFAPLIQRVRAELDNLSGGDTALHFALRRRLFKELVLR